MSENPQLQKQETEVQEVLSTEQQILKHFYKPQHIQDVLLALRDVTIQDRAYMKLNFSNETIYSAAAASSYALARLHLLDQLIEAGKVIDLQS